MNNLHYATYTGRVALVTCILMIKTIFVLLLLHERGGEKKSWLRVTDALSLQFLLFHV